jgi:hypothetical protein
MTEAQRNLLRHRVFCSFLLHVKEERALVFGGAVICILDRARGAEAFDDFCAATVAPRCYEAYFGTSSAHPASAPDRLATPRDVDLLCHSDAHARRLLDAVCSGAPSDGRRLRGVAFRVARFSERSTASAYGGAPLFAALFRRRRFVARVADPLPPIYDARPYRLEREACEALLLDVVTPSAASAAWDFVSSAAHPNWLRHLILAFDDEALPPGRRPVRGLARVLPCRLLARFLLPPYVEARLAAEVSRVSVAHLQRLAAARVTCGSLAFGDAARACLEALAREPAALALLWGDRDTRRWQARFVDVLIRELAAAWVNPYDSTLRPGGWRLVDERLLGEVVERLEQGRVLDERLTAWCARRRLRDQNGRATIVRLACALESHVRLEMHAVSVDHLRDALLEAFASLPPPRGLPLLPPERLGLRIPDACDFVSYSVSDYERLPVFRLLAAEVPRDDGRIPARLSGAADGVVAALTTTLEPDARETCERARWRG